MKTRNLFNWHENKIMLDMTRNKTVSTCFHSPCTTNRPGYKICNILIRKHSLSYLLYTEISYQINLPKLLPILRLSCNHAYLTIDSDLQNLSSAVHRLTCATGWVTYARQPRWHLNIFQTLPRWVSQSRIWE